MFDKKSKMYDEYRPEYPSNILDELEKYTCLNKNQTIAEIGCGTGKFTKHIINTGAAIYAVEKNKEMFSFVEKKYNDIKNLELLHASAEHTSLKSNTCNTVICAQSFHLFDSNKAKYEFERILKPNGVILLIWYFSANGCEILDDIRRMFYSFGVKLDQPGRLAVSKEKISDIFKPRSVIHSKIGFIVQKLNEQEFLNSMTSSSYAPKDNEDSHKNFITEAQGIFNKHCQDGILNYEYEINLFMISHA